MNNLPKVYDVKTDDMIEVTQEWCNDVALSMNDLALMRLLMLKLLSLHMRKDKSKINAIIKILEV